ncbi:MAG TPA: guanine deaminase [Bryobacteraceae bacterium]|nr:guanine deaminase [Bryobacteraceae bacterium]
MTPASGGELLRAPLFHTPRNPFREARALESYADGGLLIHEGRIAACSDYAALSASHPDAATIDLRGGFLLPGFVDTHTHFPQLRILGGLGRSLLDWLERCALPEEARMADHTHACRIARAFVRSLAAHGTTTACVFGAHFAPATAALFEAAQSAGLRMAAGQVLSDRRLLPELHQTPERAYRESSLLIDRFHRQGRLLYAVTPRFALSTSEAMLEVCQTLLAEHEELLLQTHINENADEIAEVARAFPGAPDYLTVYEKFGLAGPNAILAHNVHPTNSELERLASSRATVAHCPSSNAALGSGLFPMKRHIHAGVRVALGADVGGGTGFGMLKEGLQAYLLQRIAPDGMLLDAGHLLYLSTLAGAEALGLGKETGDFHAGKSADFVYLRPPAASPLAAVLEREQESERMLAAIFTLAGAESIQEVRVAGTVVYRSANAERR